MARPGLHGQPCCSSLALRLAEPVFLAHVLGVELLYGVLDLQHHGTVTYEKKVRGMCSMVTRVAQITSGIPRFGRILLLFWVFTESTHLSMAEVMPGSG